MQFTPLRTASWTAIFETGFFFSKLFGHFQIVYRTTLCLKRGTRGTPASGSSYMHRLRVSEFPRQSRLARF